MIKPKKPYMRVIRTNKTKGKPNKTNKTKEKPKKTIEKPMISTKHLAKTIEKPKKNKTNQAKTMKITKKTKKTKVWRHYGVSKITVLFFFGSFQAFFGFFNQ